MNVELIPSVLATTKRQLQKRLAVAQRLAPTVHLDVMDGRFVSARSVPLSTIAFGRLRPGAEIHAMVTNFTQLTPFVLQLQPKRVYVQVELGRRLLPILNLLRSMNIDCGVAIKPATPIARLAPYLRTVRSVLVLSVQPGRYHAPFLPTVLPRISAIHHRWPRVVIACDGGMNVETIPQVVKAGARRIIVGSDVMLNPHPALEWRRLKRLTTGR